ncbi:MAG: DEAD/DEAH box helicase [Candidatus Saccharimonadales bacterium]
MFVKPAMQTEQVEYTPLHQFEDFKLNELLKKNIATKGFVIPSPIQDQAIPLGLEGTDVVGIANTGTGKTAAFALPLLHRLMEEPQSKALIVAPTRELAQQIEDECRSFAKGSGLRGVLIIGGASMGAQLRDLKANPSVVIGTPGRLKDHVQRGTLKLSHFNIAVLDEVDRMLDMGFIKDVRFLLGELAEQRQSYFFSATMDANIRGLISGFLHNPVTVSVKTGDTSENVEQNIVRYQSPADKLDQLHDALIHENTKKALVFDETKRSVDRLSNMLQERGFKVDSIHGGKSQGQRQRALDKFKRSEINVLVATDVAARGIDVADVTHVINYSTPQTYDDYVHRIGRAGRAGKTGYALTFVDKY